MTLTTLAVALVLMPLAIVPAPPPTTAPNSPPTTPGPANSPDVANNDESARPAMREIELPLTRFELLGTGGEPRTQLRIDLEVGQRHRVELTAENLRNRFSEDGQRQMERPLPFRTVLLTEVTEIEADGTATVAIVVESSAAEPSRLHTVEEAAAMRAAARALAGLRMQVRVTETGRLLALRAEPPRPDDDEHRETAERQLQRVADAIARTIVPLPEVAVGPGARWDTIVNERFEGVERRQIGEFRLERIEVDGDGDGSGDGDEVAVISRRTRISALAQPGNPETIPGASNVEVSHHSGFGQGEIFRSLSLLFPRRSTDETISTVMTTGRIAGERLIVSDQHFARVSAETTEIRARPRRRIGE